MSIFLEKGLSQIPRILGFIDRAQDSSTCGCCDRAFWHYKVIDFPNARMQESAWALALAVRIEHPQNRFFNNERLRVTIKQVLDHWAAQRHADGSVDESYPMERHFCATAFTVYAATESILLLPGAAQIDLTSSGEFLKTHQNMDVSNQMACAAEALYNLYMITSDLSYKTAAMKKIDQLLQTQSTAGYFNEYGGFDLGYDSITLSFLAGLYTKSGREDLRQAALRCIDHLRTFIDEDGYFSPKTMSRNTQFLYPYGFLRFAPDLLKRIEQGLSKDVILNPAWMDDRYCIPLTANYLKTALDGDPL